MYPDSLEEQALVHQFLHMHHTLVRLATYHLMAPHVVKPLNLPQTEPNPLSIFQTDNLASSFASDNPHETGNQTVTVIAEFLENHYFPGQSTFLCGGSDPTVADLTCYSELGQFHFANLFDFEPYPTLTRWLKAMRNVPHHDAVHAYNIDLGDILTQANTFERFIRASEMGMDALVETGLASY